VFGALISATDPVAVVAVFREVGVPRRLLTLVEGESLLNDGVAIVLFAILVEAATGGSVSVLAGVLDFLAVFAGGALIGLLLGLVAALVLPWLDPLPAAAMSLALAYGSFVLADAVLGFSGVMATAVAGTVLAGLAPSRASAEVREMWTQTWEALDYVANAVLFLLIGLVIGPGALLDHAGAILLAAVVVLVARALAVVPVVWLLERVAHIPRLGRRNEAVLIWGGLRGGVALALALALPEELVERELLIALTGGVVLVTLLLNATTIRWLVSRLGLDRPSDADQYVMALAHMSAVEAARREADRPRAAPRPAHHRTAARSRAGRSRGDGPPGRPRGRRVPHRGGPRPARGAPHLPVAQRRGTAATGRDAHPAARGRRRGRRPVAARREPRPGEQPPAALRWPGAADPSLRGLAPRTCGQRSGRAGLRGGDRPSPRRPPHRGGVRRVRRALRDPPGDGGAGTPHLRRVGAGRDQGAGRARLRRSSERPGPARAAGRHADPGRGQPRAEAAGGQRTAARPGAPLRLGGAPTDSAADR
jgi:Kef-type K+ transport system membrane component KefB